MDEKEILIFERIANALERIAFAMAPESPNYRRPLADFPAFDWASVGATVTATDGHGVAMVEWGGYEWTRRNKADFGNQIWFARPAGRDETGNNKYLRLITFSPPTPAKRVSADIREVIAPIAPPPAQPSPWPVPTPVRPGPPPQPAVVPAGTTTGNNPARDPDPAEEMFSYFFTVTPREVTVAGRPAFDRYRREVGARPATPEALSEWIKANPRK